ncbi:MAG: hypothetical protein WC460_02955 [Patescibacteria group bacterium]
MDITAHVFRSLAKIQRNNPQLLINEWAIISPLAWEIHAWFDAFFGLPPYDGVYSLYYHREVRHHREGIIEAVKVFSQRFGQRYADLIEEIAKDHVRDDFNEIPSRAECSLHYLNQKMGW